MFNPVLRRKFPSKTDPAISIGSLSVVAALLLAIGLAVPTRATSTNSSDLKTPAAVHFGQLFEYARARYETNSTDAETAWKFAKACFDWADYAANNEDRERIAQEGIAAARKLTEQSSNSAPAHYYLALNLGQLARTKKIGALKLVSQMETEFKLALALDPQFDYAGPYRTLGMLYDDAPGWPISIGSKIKSRQNLQAAAQAAPEYPENLLALVETELGWGETAAAARDLKTLDAVWPAAKKLFVGDAWASDWPVWNLRRETLRQKIGQPSKTLKSPRNSFTEE